MPGEYLGRIGNRYSQGTRPSHPTKPDFDIEYEHIPESFTAVDVSVGERKHILLYTGAQIKLLSRARRWFVDGTFKVCLIFQ